MHQNSIQLIYERHGELSAAIEMPRVSPASPTTLRPESRHVGSLHGRRQTAAKQLHRVRKALLE
jgi:hypothetical protein